MSEDYRRSFLGSSKLGTFKSKLSRKPSNSDRPTTNSATPQQSSTMNNPFGSPAPATRRPRMSLSPVPPCHHTNRPPTGVEPPPPSYNEAVTTPNNTVDAASRRSAVISADSLSTAEDPHAFLAAFDTVFLIDDSGSMAGRSWRETGAALRAIAPVCASHDADGVDVYFLNARNRHPSSAGAVGGGFHNLRSAAAVEDLFSAVRPGGGTPTGTRIQAILGPYVTAFERAVAAAGGDADAAGVKPVNLIVVTDGVPTDDPESVLLGLARRLDRANAPPYQVGVQFFQVGDEPGAREALLELDDGIAGEVGAGAVRDMVDTTTWDGERGVLTADGILKAVLGGVVKRLDRRRISLEGRRGGRRGAA